MGKKKSKKQSRSKDQPQSPDSQGPLGQSTLEGLGVNVQQIGATLAGVLIGEIVEAATAQLVQRFDGSQKSHPGANSSTADQVSPLLKDSLGEESCEGVKTAIGNGVDAVRSTASDLTPEMPEVPEMVDMVKGVGQRLKQKSMATLGNSSETLLEGVTHGLKTAVAALAQASVDKPSTSKKKGKKKKKKK